MIRRFLATSFVAVVAVLGTTSVSRAEEFEVDGVHSSVSFKIQHAGLSYVHGRFNSFSGKFNLEEGKTSFELTIKVDSVDTNNAKRDEHLRAPDIFNAKQFPTITFKSTSVKAIDGGYEVTGDVTMHGVTKPATFKMLGGKTTEFPKGVKRTGFSTDFVLKRTEFGMDKFTDSLGAEVYVSIGLEGTAKK